MDNITLYNYLVEIYNVAIISHLEIAEMQTAQIYVNVIAKFDKDGTITPITLEWKNGVLYDVERVRTLGECPSRRMGGQGVRFMVQIDGSQAILSFEDPCWFIGRKEF